MNKRNLLQQQESKAAVCIYNIMILPKIISIISWDNLKFLQILFSPQVRRCTVVTEKHGIYELPHEFPKALEISDMSRNFIEW